MASFAEILNSIRTTKLESVELDLIINLCQIRSLQINPDLGTADIIADINNTKINTNLNLPDNVIDIPALRRAGKFPISKSMYI